MLLVLPIIAAPAQAQTVDELKEQLYEKEQIIEALKARLEALEQNVPPVSSDQQDGPLMAAEVPVPPGAPNSLADEDANRALERILVQRGGLVLAPGSFELVPELSFTYSGSSALRNRSEIFRSAVGVRAGLPGDMQVQARIPYLVRRSASFGSSSGIGDLEVGLTKELLRERGDRPSVLVGAQWTVPTGKSGIAESVRLPSTTQSGAVGGGFHVLQAGVTAVKKDDPLVLVGSLAYAVTFQERFSSAHIKPGDVLAAGLGAILAASPETSIGLTANLAYASDLKLNGEGLARTNQLIGTAGVEFAKILTENAVLNLATEFGVTDDAPDLRIVVSVPFRF